MSGRASEKQRSIAEQNMASHWLGRIRIEEFDSPKNRPKVVAFVEVHGARDDQGSLEAIQHALIDMCAETGELRAVID